MDKISIIKRIVKHHPAFGTDKGWSTYTGGMADTGYWYWDKMVDVPDNELEVFANLLERQQAETEKRWEEEKQERDRIALLPQEQQDKLHSDKIILVSEQTKKFFADIDCKLLFGK